MTEQQPASGIGFVVLTPGRWRWLTFRRTGRAQLLFFLDCSVPGLRGRFRRVHSPWLPREQDRGSR